MDELEQRFRRDAVAAQELAASTADTARQWADLCDASNNTQAMAWQTRAAFDYKSARVLRALAYEASL